MNQNEVMQKISLPLDQKIILAKRRLKEYYNHYEGDIYISFSGGKDSTVLLHLVRSLYPDTVGVFVNTGLEYPEINSFVKSIDNVCIIKPELSFKEVLSIHGYPVVSKLVSRQLRDLKNPTDKNFNTRRLYGTGIKMDGSYSKYFKLPKKWQYLIDSDIKISERCCNVMKKTPFKKFERNTGLHGINGVMATNSRNRMLSYLKTGCNSFSKNGMCRPLSIWTDSDIWDYIKLHNLNYSSIYDTGVTNTGCMFCMFGVHLESSPNRFQLMQKTHPKMYRYCMDDLGLDNVLNILNVDH